MLHYNRLFYHNIDIVWEYMGAICLLYVVSGSLVGYLILIGDFVNDALEQMGISNDSIPAQRQIIIIIFTVIILTPLVLLKDLKKLGPCSFIGIAAIAYCVLLLIFTTISYTNKDDFILGTAYSTSSTFELMDWNIGFFIMTNVCTQAYVCHYSVQRIYLGMKDRTINKMWIANGISYLFVMILYLIFAICGYILYGSKCPSDVLIAFVGGIDVIIARLAMCISVCGTFPLAFVSCQATLEDKFFNKERNTIWNYENKPKLRTMVIITTQCVYLILACIIPTIGPVVSVNGAVSTIGLISLFPIAAVWKVGFNKKNYYKEYKRKGITTTKGGNYQSVSVNDDNNTYQRVDNNKRSLLTKILLSLMLSIGVVFGAMGFYTEFKEVSS